MSYYPHLAPFPGLLAYPGLFRRLGPGHPDVGRQRAALSRLWASTTSASGTGQCRGFCPMTLIARAGVLLLCSVHTTRVLLAYTSGRRGHALHGMMYHRNLDGPYTGALVDPASQSGHGILSVCAVMNGAVMTGGVMSVGVTCVGVTCVGVVNGGKGNGGKGNGEKGSGGMMTVDV